MVGSTIGSKLVALGHEVVMGSRKAGNEKAVAWAAAAGAGASHGTFAAAAAHGELVFNCTSGAGAVDAVTAAGADNLRGKILVDIAVPLPSCPATRAGRVRRWSRRPRRAAKRLRLWGALGTADFNIRVVR